MNPRFANLDPAHQRLGNAEFRRESIAQFAGGKTALDFADIGFGELRPGMSLSPADLLWTPFVTMVAALRCGIGNIVCLSAKEEIGWANARRVVTAVEHPESIRDRTNENDVCDSVRELLAEVLDEELPVTIGIAIALPFPTAILCDNNTLHEKFPQGGFPSTRHHHTSQLSMKESYQIPGGLFNWQ